MLGKAAFDILENLSLISENNIGVTRLYLTKEHKLANDFLINLMETNGLKTKVDPVGNIIGEYFCGDNNAKTLVIGSHQDTVKNGGKYDGIMGVILPIVAFNELLKEKKQLDFNFKVIGFGDEEGVRYGTTYLGSKAVAGNFDMELLNRVDEKGISLKDALNSFGLDSNLINEAKIDNIDTYLEFHIEQGPVLDNENLALGIVNVIQGSHRYIVELQGLAGHAGTVPMNYRRDAGVASCEIVSQITNLIENKENIVLTVGQLDLFPGAINVIPGDSKFSIDIRSLDNDLILKSMEEIKNIAQNICDKRGVSFKITKINEVLPTNCNKEVIESLENSFKNINAPYIVLPSGAGHDAQELEKVSKMGMIFVRCKDGISHNPLESVTENDLQLACEVLVEFLKNYK